MVIKYLCVRVCVVYIGVVCVLFVLCIIMCVLRVLCVSSVLCGWCVCCVCCFCFVCCVYVVCVLCVLCFWGLDFIFITLVTDKKESQFSLPIAHRTGTCDVPSRKGAGQHGAAGPQA